MLVWSCWAWVAWVWWVCRLVSIEEQKLESLDRERLEEESSLEKAVGSSQHCRRSLGFVLLTGASSQENLENIYFRFYSKSTKSSRKLPSRKVQRVGFIDFFGLIPLPFSSHNWHHLCSWVFFRVLESLLDPQSIRGNWIQRVSSSSIKREYELLRRVEFERELKLPLLFLVQ